MFSLCLKELVSNGMAALSLGKAHLSKLEDHRMSVWLTLKGCLTTKGLFQKDGCFGPSPLQLLVWPLHVFIRPLIPFYPPTRPSIHQSRGSHALQPDGSSPQGTAHSSGLIWWKREFELVHSKKT